MSRRVLFPIRIVKWHLLTGDAEVTPTQFEISIRWRLVPSRGWIVFRDSLNALHFVTVASPGMDDGEVDLSEAISFSAAFAQQKRAVLKKLSCREPRPEVIIAVLDEIKALDEAARLCGFPPPLRQG